MIRCLILGIHFPLCSVCDLLSQVRWWSAKFFFPSSRLSGPLSLLELCGQSEYRNPRVFCCFYVPSRFLAYTDPICLHDKTVCTILMIWPFLSYRVFCIILGPLATLNDYFVCRFISFSTGVVSADFIGFGNFRFDECASSGMQ